MKVSTVIDLKQKPVYILVYAPSGKGKTSLAKTLPLEKTLIADCENGLGSLMDVKTINYISLSRSDDGQMLSESERYARLLEFLQYLKKPETKQKFNWVFFDSLTEIAQNILKHKAEGAFTIKNGEKVPDNFAKWGEYADAMVDLLKFFRDMDHYNVVFTALEDRVDEDDGTSYYCPEVPGKKARGYILPCFDEVYRMIIDEQGQRKFVTKETSKTKAKNRLGGLEALESADLGAVYKKLKKL